VAARKRTAAHRVVAATPHGTAAPHESPVDLVRHRIWQRSFRSGAIYRNRGRGLVVLVAVAAVLLIAMSVVSRTDTTRLSSTAAIHITRSILFGGSGYEQAPAGNTIYYTYTVNGTTYSGADFRRWIDVNKHHPKVCFDPDDPSSHLLVDGSFQCGIGPRP
jgi:hypothetical protein